uniref:Cystinosin homolog n=1 Tax=Arcella intermedia TaxID=1963864 RepID=A0A6B2LF13_9EUKA|eukprot:TRINITY_DN1991_c0_g1_i1.p1 TRINITY_DN1991_c0_g1~~TRINITY_DN1991_c0_g1_i1.p1  ORF type:complete len:255 (-),score=31.19 TRINITY_DN1991_c0_g1_i1:16-759(-)
MTVVSTVSTVVGWLYFVAWSFSFYPQIYENWRRKSVVGLSFDYLALNIVGWVAYSLFNCLIFWEPSIQAQYISVYGPPIPVQPNDIFFALHAFVMTSIIIVQCLSYERGNQKVAEITILLVSCVITASFIQLFLCIGYVLTWVDYLSYFSYVKVGVTFLKYVPQVYINYRRKSTEGWSIGNIILDTTGGVLSFLQIFLDGFGSGNWKVLEGGGAKLALAIVSLIFDFIFLIQHYCLYKEATYDTIEE